MSNLSFDDLFLGRKSIRSYDPTVKIPKEEMSQILTEATRAPSSQNMQPWRFVIVESPAGKEKIEQAMMFNSQQNQTSAAIIFIFGDLQAVDNVEKIMQGPVDFGTMTPAERDQRIQQVREYYAKIPEATAQKTATLDAGLVSMSIMLTARKYGYDTCMIGGFDKENMAEILGLDPTRYFPIISLSIGKAVEDDYQSYRLPIEDVVEWQ